MSSYESQPCEWHIESTVNLVAQLDPAEVCAVTPYVVYLHFMPDMEVYPMSQTCI